MKILYCHNYYRQVGGEDICFKQEVNLLRARGHEVIEFTVHNDSLDEMSRWKAARLSFWNSSVLKRLKEILAAEKPQLMHCTNIFPLMSPAVYYAARNAGIPIVQSLHNYRLVCPGWSFYRNEKYCQDCLGKSLAWPAIVHACYRNSRAASAVTATMISFHSFLGTWKKVVDRYTTPSEFAKMKFIEGGFPAEKIEVFNNFIYPDLGMAKGSGDYAIYVGRLSEEKGIEMLLNTWEQGNELGNLKFVGDGPLASRVKEAAAKDSRITWLGFKPLEELRELIGNAAFLIMPSIYLETFGRALIEAYSMGTPVIASRQGSMIELVI